MNEHVRVCFHEAGHALAAHRFHRPIHSIAIDRAEGSGAVYCDEFQAVHRRRIAPAVWNERVFEEAVICLAGPLAEYAIFNQKLWDRWRLDMENANSWLRKSNLPFQQAAREALRTTHKLVTAPAGERAITRLAQQLLDHGPMDARDAARFFLRLKI